MIIYIFAMENILKQVHYEKIYIYCLSSLVLLKFYASKKSVC